MIGHITQTELRRYTTTIELADGYLTRAAEHTPQTFLQQVISQLPRVEARVLALLWTIAERQGIVRAMASS
ncbi:MAG: hypothetical protein ACJ780_20035 [Solirubrobacteraceae bacterium]